MLKLPAFFSTQELKSTCPPIGKNKIETCKILTNFFLTINLFSFESPLTLAACGGHVELAMLLLERGANIEEVNDEGYTPLMEAAREGHEEMVALLLSQGADINAQTEETQETALTLACCGGFLDVADFLIKAGADIELGASTPLMEAAQEGHLELVKYLLEARADVNAQTGTGNTFLTIWSKSFVFVAKQVSTSAVDFQNIQKMLENFCSGIRIYEIFSSLKINVPVSTLSQLLITKVNKRKKN